MSRLKVALTGNPNVGKSSVFNALTGLHQHTGNWTGKTVSTAKGSFRSAVREYDVIDLPGIYSLSPRSEEERLARDYLASGDADIVVAVCDATCLQRSLHLVLQCLSITKNVIVCINLMDEASLRGIQIDLSILERMLGVPVVGSSTRRRNGLNALKAAIDRFSATAEPPRPPMTSREIAREAERLCQSAIVRQKAKGSRVVRLDAFLTGTIPGAAAMLAALIALLWITISGANILSDGLSSLLAPVDGWLHSLLHNAPSWVSGAFIDGLWRVLSWVVCVMFPPMAIFFPLFTIMEDAGILPRIAFVLDRPFQACHSCGKQALTCCMGFGCNAAGVTGCRIIESSRERMLAVVTNVFTPCSGRFPILAALTSMFFSVSGSSGFVSALVLAALLVLSLLFTFLSSRLLSAVILRGEPSSVTLELPPYRRPQFGKVILESVLNRTVFVLGRAVAVAAPAGVVIWLLANISAGENSLLSSAAAILETPGRMIGLDGVILLAFLLGLPANEIVLPLILMGYLSVSVLPDIGTLDSLRAVLVQNGWTWKTALCASVFTIAHWPCSTTLLTIFREMRSVRWTMIAAVLPTAFGMITCALINLTFKIM